MNIVYVNEPIVESSNEVHSVRVQVLGSMLTTGHARREHIIRITLSSLCRLEEQDPIPEPNRMP